MDLASGQTRQVTDGRYNSTEPTWFPDSQTLAYTSDQAGAPQIYKVGINGGAPQRITWKVLRTRMRMCQLTAKPW